MISAFTEVDFGKYLSNIISNFVYKSLQTSKANMNQLLDETFLIHYVGTYDVLFSKNEILFSRKKYDSDNIYLADYVYGFCLISKGKYYKPKSLPNFLIKNIDMFIIENVIINSDGFKLVSYKIPISKFHDLKF